MATGFERFDKKTKRALFLEEMEQVVPWAKLCGLIEPHYPTGSNGRPPVGVERMLRIYFLQQWFNLSDPAVEEALYDSAVMRGFVGIDLGREPVPDETTVCKFRHLLEEHQLGGQMLEAVNLHLQSRGVRITTGTIVDATIIHAPSSTKNREQQRDPEMHQTRKGKQWYFGMKAHVGVDSKTKLIHTALVTPAHVADATVLPELLHGEETSVNGVCQDPMPPVTIPGGGSGGACTDDGVTDRRMGMAYLASKPKKCSKPPQAALPSKAPPKSVARQQCENNAQNTFNDAVGETIWNNIAVPFKAAGGGAVSGGIVGCVLTVEGGCFEGVIPGLLTGIFGGALEGTIQAVSSDISGYRQAKGQLAVAYAACQQIP